MRAQGTALRRGGTLHASARSDSNHLLKFGDSKLAGLPAERIMGVDLRRPYCALCRTTLIGVFRVISIIT